MKELLFAGVAALVLSSSPCWADQWFSYDVNAKTCMDEGTPQQQVGEYGDHDVNDDTPTYGKNWHGEMMYAKIRATDNGDTLQYVTLHHSYPRNGKFMTGKESCEEVRGQPIEP